MTETGDGRGRNTGGGGEKGRRDGGARRGPKSDGRGRGEPGGRNQNAPGLRGQGRGRPAEGGDRRRDGKSSSGPRRNDHSGRPERGEYPQRERRDERTSRGERPVDPAIDADVTGHELGEDVMSDLGSLSGGLATRVAQYLVMAARLVDEEPERAHEHALAARRRTSRVGLIREAVGVTAYATGDYAQALAELRAARRITGSAEYLPMMADCERGLGRPRRALDLAADPAIAELPTEDRIEMQIVAAGARRDLGEVGAAVVSLQIPELRSQAQEPWVPRLRYAYADLLEAAGRKDEAKRWFLRAADADLDEATDAAERAAQLGEA